MFSRQIKSSKTKSWFLFGPRQTGKSTYVKSLMGPTDLYIDLLPQRAYLNYSKTPGRLREEILAHLQKYNKFTCIIDGVQKIPALLDEVHALIESTDIRFILTGSSARKIRRGGANLLAGRAYTYNLFPLTAKELGKEFNLDKALVQGCLPVLWQSADDEPREFLRSYAETYLREEVAAEGLVRDIGPFSNFLDIAAANDGEIVNYSNVARECAVSVKTVQQYYQILEETFLAFRLPAWRKSARKRLVAHPRYYFFDTGVVNVLAHTLNGQLNANIRGRRFEQFVITQIIAAINYMRLDLQLYYWRTNHGSEVDLLVCRGEYILAAVEIKSSQFISTETLSGLKNFCSEHPETPAFVLGDDQTPRLISDKILLMNWDEFISEKLEGL